MVKALAPTPEELATIKQARTLLRAHLPISDLLAEDAPLGSLQPPEDFDGENPAPFLDLTNLKPQATGADIQTLCEKARTMGAAAVCVNACRVALAALCLKGCGVKPICVVGFPLGSDTPDITAFQTARAIKDGAEEIDMVMNVGALKEGDYKRVYSQINEVVAAAQNVPVKVILEVCKLTDVEVAAASLIAAEAGAAFVKTSTGFSLDKLADQPHTGATVARVRLMRLTVGDEVGVKASGGIKTPADARTLLENGANRLGASGS